MGKSSGPPVQDGWTTSGHQAVLSAGIPQDDMRYLVQVAQQRGIRRAVLVKEIIAAWRTERERLAAVSARDWAAEQAQDGDPGQPVPELTALFQRDLSAPNVIYDEPRDGDLVVDTDPPIYYRGSVQVVLPVPEDPGPTVVTRAWYDDGSEG
jgi:hypothetical protein